MGARGARGFTLIELLVVLVIIGCLVGLAVFSTGIAGPSRELNNEAERLAGLIGVLVDEAVLDNREYGLRLENDRYQVLRFDEAKARWEPVGKQPHVLPAWAGGARKSLVEVFHPQLQPLQARLALRVKLGGGHGPEHRPAGAPRQARRGKGVRPGRGTRTVSAECRASSIPAPRATGAWPRPCARSSAAERSGPVSGFPPCAARPRSTA